MKKIFSLTLAVICFCTCFSAIAGSNPVGIKINEMATTDLDGNEVTGEIFSQYKLTYLNLWATWCGPCLSELGHIQAMYEDEDFQARGLNVMGLLWEDSSSTVKAAKKTLKEKGCTYTNIRIGSDPQLNNLVNNSGDGIPVSYLLNSEGEVIKFTVGSMNASAMKTFINQGFAMVETEPTPTPTQEPSPTPTNEPTPTDMPAEPVEIKYTEDAVLGDANNDGSINTADAAWTLKYAAEMFKETEYTQLNLNNADTNLDGDVNTADAAIILKACAEIKPLPEKKTFSIKVQVNVQNVTVFTVETYADFLKQPLLKWEIVELDENGAIVKANKVEPGENQSWVLLNKQGEEEIPVEGALDEVAVTDGAEFVLYLRY